MDAESGAYQMPIMWTLADYNSATARWALRNALHSIAYALANANATQNCAPGTTYKTALSPWKIPFTALAVLFYALFSLYIWRTVLRIRDQKQHPEHFKPSRKECKKAAE